MGPIEAISTTRKLTNHTDVIRLDICLREGKQNENNNNYVKNVNKDNVSQKLYPFASEPGYVHPALFLVGRDF